MAHFGRTSSVTFSGALRCGFVMLGLITAAADAGPPRSRNEPLDEHAVEPAAFAELERVESARTITPRDPSEKSPAKPSQKTFGNSSLVGTVVCLFAVFGVFLAARVWLTRHGPAGFRGLPVEALELLGKRVIEPRVSIHVVRCGPKILVLGVSPDGIRTLTEITDPVEIDLLAGACRRKETPRGSAASFSRMFRHTETHSAPVNFREA